MFAGFQFGVPDYSKFLLELQMLLWEALLSVELYRTFVVELCRDVDFDDCLILRSLYHLLEQSPSDAFHSVVSGDVEVLYIGQLPSMYEVVYDPLVYEADDLPIGICHEQLVIQLLQTLSQHA